MKPDYPEIVEHIKAQEFDKLLPYHFPEVAVYEYEGKIVPKGRPRSGKGGRMYTPTETRTYEAAVRKWGVDVQMPKVPYPIRVQLTFYDITDDPMLRVHSMMGLVFNQKGDVDNYTKAVTDALNGVAYRDDKQIVEIVAKRRWSRRSGFRLQIERAGLTKLEYDNLLKRLK